MLRAIPVLGLALAAVVMFFGLGAIFVYVLDWRRGELAPEAKAVPALGA